MSAFFENFLKSEYKIRLHEENIFLSLNNILYNASTTLAFSTFLNIFFFYQQANESQHIDYNTQGGYSCCSSLLRYRFCNCRTSASATIYRVSPRQIWVRKEEKL